MSIQLNVKYHSSSFSKQLDSTKTSVHDLTQWLYEETNVEPIHQKIVGLKMKGGLELNFKKTLDQVGVKKKVHRLILIGRPVAEIEGMKERDAIEREKEKKEQERMEILRLKQLEEERLERLRMEEELKLQKERMIEAQKQQEERERKRRKMEEDRKNLKFKLNVFSFAFSGNEKKEKSCGGKFILPQSILKSAMDQNFPLPIVFKVRRNNNNNNNNNNSSSSSDEFFDDLMEVDDGDGENIDDNFIVGGTLEFTAKENEIYIPFEKFQQQQFVEGDSVIIERYPLKKGKSVDITPLSKLWIDIPLMEREMVLQNGLNYFHSNIKRK